ncbi:Putative Fimbrin [Penicillium brasilianum]|uniref:Fimbrin n=1 Tax=Penicillium brasilianum TaxID=104259 RepID=A0A0F7TVY1_PENBI|nr:Putative Fimbrin [Penicillium brasilianum]
MNVLKLQKRFPQLDQGEIFSLQDAFRRLDVDDRGYLDEASAIKATQQSERQPYDVVRQALKGVELDSSRRVELEDYIDLVARLRSGPAPGAAAASPAAVIQGAGAGAGAGPGGARHVSKGSVGGGRIHVQGSSANVTHTINEDERTEFTRHINAVLAGDPDIGDMLPFPTDTFEMFDKCKDGLVLAKLINDSVPDTIDERVLNKAGKKIKQLNAFHMTENNNIVINSAKGIGCSVVNIGSGDIIEVREHLILGLIWQVIRRGLLGKIDIKLHPELYRLLEEDETLEQFLRLPPEQILLRWFNYHLKNAKWERRVTNFSTDVKDGENYTVLLNQLAPDVCSRSPLQTRDLLQRAEEVLTNADKLDCRKFLTPTSLVAGNPKLNLAFVANLFNTHPGLDPITEEEKLEVEDFDAEGEREARVFTLWLNSLDVQPAVNSLFDDLRDGTILLQAYDKVIPGSVNWRHVNKRPASGGELMRFKAVENTNYSIELGKHHGFSLVGVQGADITDGQRTLTLGLVWQLMRRDITRTLSALAQRLGKREITDAEMIRWANDMSKSGGQTSAIRSFKDPSIGTGRFLLDVLNGMKSSYVDYDLVTPGRSDEEAYANAKLSISIARKMGATIWLVPEDICQVRSRLVTTFIGSLMATHEKM